MLARALSIASRTAPKYRPASISTAARPARAARQALCSGLIKDGDASAICGWVRGNAHD
jgi:hypothetical protein